MEQMRQIPVEIYTDFAQFVNNVIEQLVMMIECPVSDIITMLAKRYQVFRDDIVKCLKSIDSPYTANNNVIFFDGEKMVRRTTFHKQMWNAMNKVGKKLYRIDPDADISEIYLTVKDQYTIKQGSCALRNEEETNEHSDNRS